MASFPVSRFTPGAMGARPWASGRGSNNKTQCMHAMSDARHHRRARPTMHAPTPRGTLDGGRGGKKVRREDSKHTGYHDALERGGLIGHARGMHGATSARIRLKKSIGNEETCRLAHPPTPANAPCERRQTGCDCDERGGREHSPTNPSRMHAILTHRTSSDSHLAGTESATAGVYRTCIWLERGWDGCRPPRETAASRSTSMVSGQVFEAVWRVLMIWPAHEFGAKKGGFLVDLQNSLRKSHVAGTPA